MRQRRRGSLKRCPWAEADALTMKYHDREWGVPVHDDRLLFEFLILDGVQAGLSWSLVLKKRENYRSAFDHFDAEKIARYTDRKVARLLSDPGIVRNRLKVLAAVANARAFLAVRDEFGSFDSYIWRFTDGATVRNRWRRGSDIPASTPASEAMGRDLKGRGFRFVGSTICYAYMQGVGMVNDHLVGCFRHKQLS